MGDLDQHLLNQRQQPALHGAVLLLDRGFTYFYVAITLNPEEISDNMKRYGGFIPGIRAGRPTTEYLEYVISRITFPGAIYLGLIALDSVGCIQRHRNQPKLPIRWNLDL